MPGNLLLGAKYLNNPAYAQFGQELMDSCYKTWKNSPTGLAPENWGWIDESPIGNLSSKLYSSIQAGTFERIGYIPTDNRYLLRPGNLLCIKKAGLLFRNFLLTQLFIMQKLWRVYSIFTESQAKLNTRSVASCFSHIAQRSLLLTHPLNLGYGVGNIQIHWKVLQDFIWLCITSKCL